MDRLLRNKKGITLIELLVALVISALVVGATYRTFTGQQKTYSVQEQVVDMQQNVRAGINRMMREIRMAGFGNVSMVLPGVTIGGRTYNNVVNPNDPTAGSVTILSGLGSATITAVPASNQITVSSLTDGHGNTLFDMGDKKYVSIGGVESYAIINIVGNTLTLSGSMTFNHLAGTPVFAIRAVSYQVAIVGGIPTLLRNENTGAGWEALLDNIENLQFGYLDADGNTTANPPDIRTIRVTLRAKADTSDPEYKADGGYRKREIASNVHLKNVGLEL